MDKICPQIAGGGSLTGLRSHNRGEEPIPIDSTFNDVDKGLVYTPRDDPIEPLETLGNAKDHYGSNEGMATFRLNVDVDPGKDVTSGGKLRES